METLVGFLVFVILANVQADYNCLCNYDIEMPVYSVPSINTGEAGYLYEFDCKPVYGNQDDQHFQAIQFEHKVVYVPLSSAVSLQLCQGSVSPLDKVTQTASKSTSTTSTNTPPLTTSRPTASSTSSTITTLSTTSTTNNPSIPSRTSTVSKTTTPSTVSTTTAPSTVSTNATQSLLSTTSTPLTISTNKSLSTTSTTTTPTPPSTTSTPLTTSTTTTPLTTSTTTTPATTSTAKATTTPATTSTAKTTTTTTLPQCPSGWTMFKTSCYQFHTSHRTTWDQANAQCLSMGSHIVFVETDDEHQFLISYLRNHIDLNIHDNSDTGTWIGATDRDREGLWVWRDSYRRTDQNVQFVKWQPGQPDSHDQDCAAMIGRHNFDWHDYECDQSMFYVCETKANGVSSKNSVTQKPVPANILQSCEAGWSTYKDSCYKFVTDQGRLEWDHAYEHCQTFNSHLVIIESQDEDQYVANQMRSRIDTDNNDDEETGVWTAGTDEDIEGVWVWQKALHHTDKPISGYSNWYPGEPDTGDGEKEEDCLCLIGNKGFHWQDYRCRDNMYFVCEKARSLTVGTSFIG